MKQQTRAFSSYIWPYILNRRRKEAAGRRKEAAGRRKSEHEGWSVPNLGLVLGIRYSDDVPFMSNYLVPSF